MYTHTHLFACWFGCLSILYFQDLRSTRTGNDNRSHLFSLLSLCDLFIAFCAFSYHMIIATRLEQLQEIVQKHMPVSGNIISFSWMGIITIYRIVTIYR